MVVFIRFLKIMVQNSASSTRKRTHVVILTASKKPYLSLIQIVSSSNNDSDIGFRFLGQGQQFWMRQ